MEEKNSPGWKQESPWDVVENVGCESCSVLCKKYIESLSSQITDTGRKEKVIKKTPKSFPGNSRHAENSLTKAKKMVSKKF